MFQPIRTYHVIVSTYSTTVPWSCDKSRLSVHIMWSIPQSRDVQSRKLKAIKYSVRDKHCERTFLLRPSQAMKMEAWHASNSSTYVWMGMMDSIVLEMHLLTCLAQLVFSSSQMTQCRHVTIKSWLMPVTRGLYPFICRYGWLAIIHTIHDVIAEIIWLWCELRPASRLMHSDVDL